MRKRLKTIKQILSEYEYKGYEVNQFGESSQIDIDGGSKKEYFIIAPAMFKYFGKEINVYDAGTQSDKYEYFIIGENMSFNKWWFKDDWFECINLLEDSLFEI